MSSLLSFNNLCFTVRFQNVTTVREIPEGTRQGGLVTSETLGRAVQARFEPHPRTRRLRSRQHTH